MFKSILRFILPAAMLLMLAACGTDRSDPQSVAQAAMDCYSRADFKGVMEYVDPNDSDYLRQLERMIENGQDWQTEKEFTFTKMYDQDKHTKVAEYTYLNDSGNEWRMRVILEERDGKWYCAGIR